MVFSEKIKAHAIKSLNNELAWKRDNIFTAIKELTDCGYAILGGDVWAITTKETEQSLLTYVNSKNVAIGIINGLDGNDYVFSWENRKNTSETWNEYVKRSGEETIISINKMDAEKVVAVKFKDDIYYNLVYTNEVEYYKMKGF